MKKIRFILSILLIIITLLLINYFSISSYSNARIFTEVKQLPAYHYALILGSGKNQTFAPENFAFTGRMKASIELFKNHKDLKKIVVSGLSNKSNYDEPNEMRNYLLMFGVIDTMIITDDAGTRTIESILHIKNTFTDKQIIIVSQKAHLQRAVYIANNLDLNAVGYEAKELPQGMSIKLYTREVFARLKCTFEILKYKMH